MSKDEENEEPYHAPDPSDFLVGCSVSGGKDSTAMALFLKEQGIEYRSVFADTGWEDRKTYEYVRDVLPGVIGPVDWVRYEVEFDDEREQIALDFEERLGHYSSMIRLILKKGMFPSRVRRFCTQHTKVFPIIKYLKELNEDVINAVGIRAAESASRAKMPEWEWSDGFDCATWSPLIKWSEQDVIDIHHRHGIRPNSMYLEGAERGGCWPCIYARKSEINHFAKDKKRVQIMRDLEAVVGRLPRERHEARGDVLKHEPTWFQAKSGYIIDEEGRRVKDNTTWPIDKAIAWSNTSRGGRQFEMFGAFGAEAGCLRWGLCDTGKPGDEQ